MRLLGNIPEWPGDEYSNGTIMKFTSEETELFRRLISVSEDILGFRNYWLDDTLPNEHIRLERTLEELLSYTSRFLDEKEVENEL